LPFIAESRVGGSIEEVVGFLDELRRGLAAGKLDCREVEVLTKTAACAMRGAVARTERDTLLELHDLVARAEAAVQAGERHAGRDRQHANADLVAPDYDPGEPAWVPPPGERH